MALTDTFWSILGKLLIERPARKKTVGELISDLEEGSAETLWHARKAPDTADNREILRHVIAIERWGQRRLEGALGKLFVMDESDAYRPAKELGCTDLRDLFQEAREETVRMARALQQQNVPGDRRVQHNQWGDLTVKGWLYYLNFHANKDMKELEGT